LNEKIEKERFEKFDLKIRFHLFGAPPLLLELNKNGVRVSERNFKNANVTIISDLSTLSILKEKKNRKRNLIRALLTGKIKVKGGFFSLFRFYRSFWLIEEIFSGKIS